MTKDVIVTIDGRQLGEEDGVISTTASGIYHQRGNKHFVYYDEKAEDGEGITKNTIKITPNQIEIIKKGINSSHMIFHVKETTDTCYQTPYGSLLLTIQTLELQVEDSLDEIRVKLQYTLSAKDAHLSDNSIMIRVCSK